MPAPAAVILPTAGRPAYLDVALASIVPQARALGADVLVVDDGPSAETRAVAERHGARYVAHDRSRGLNAARNTGARETTAPLLAYVDDDVEVHAGWLASLIVADASQPADIGVFTGPILARFDDHPLPSAAVRIRRSPISISVRRTATATTPGARTWRCAVPRCSASGRLTRAASSTATSRSGRRG